MPSYNHRSNISHCSTINDPSIINPSLLSNYSIPYSIQATSNPGFGMNNFGNFLAAESLFRVPPSLSPLTEDSSSASQEYTWSESDNLESLSSYPLIVSGQTYTYTNPQNFGVYHSGPQTEYTAGCSNYPQMPPVHQSSLGCYNITNNHVIPTPTSNQLSNWEPSVEVHVPQPLINVVTETEPLTTPIEPPKQAANRRKRRRTSTSPEIGTDTRKSRRKMKLVMATEGSAIICRWDGNCGASIDATIPALEEHIYGYHQIQRYGTNERVVCLWCVPPVSTIDPAQDTAESSTSPGAGPSTGPGTVQGGTFEVGNGTGLVSTQEARSSTGPGTLANDEGVASVVVGKICGCDLGRNSLAKHIGSHLHEEGQPSPYVKRSGCCGKIFVSRGSGDKHLKECCEYVPRESKPSVPKRRRLNDSG